MYQNHLVHEFEKLLISMTCLRPAKLSTSQKVMEGGLKLEATQIKQMLLPVLSFKKEDDHSLDCRFISVSLFSILFEDTLFSIFFKETLFSIFFDETSFLNVKVNSEKIFS